LQTNIEPDYGFLDELPVKEVNVVWHPDKETVTRIADVLNIDLSLPTVTRYKTSEDATREVDTAIQFDDEKIDRYEAFEYEGIPCIRICPKQSDTTHLVEFTSDGIRGIDAVQDYLLAA